MQIRQVYACPFTTRAFPRLGAQKALSADGYLAFRLWEPEVQVPLFPAEAALLS